MNSTKVKNSIGPFIVVAIFIAASFGLGEIVEVRNWQSIMMLATVEIFAFFVIANSGFDLNKTRALCSIIALVVLAFSSPFALLAWGTYNLNISLIDSVFNVFYLTYQPFSIVISIMLIAVSISPPEVFDDIASRFRIDSYLLRFNMFCGLHIFSINPAAIK